MGKRRVECWFISGFLLLGRDLSVFKNNNSVQTM